MYYIKIRYADLWAFPDVKGPHPKYLWKKAAGWPYLTYPQPAALIAYGEKPTGKAGPLHPTQFNLVHHQ